ncbi:MAG: response regulator [Leptolyngbyaceae cyanobacterium]
MKTVLIIEDELQTRNIFLKCLQFEGFQAHGASNGIDGIRLAQQYQPDLVVCDIMMPDIDGYSVLSTLRQSRETAVIPLIFLTAKVTMTDLRRGMELGADDYLTKPCTVDQFLSAITTRLQRHAEIHSALKRPSKAAPIPAHPTARATAATSCSSIFPDCAKLAKVFEFIEQHYCEPINLSDVANAIGYSPAYLTNLVQAETGLTIKRWITERRMFRARQLLQTTSDSVKLVAELSGYTDASYFTRQFRKFHGVSPQAWRNSSVHCKQTTA